MKTTETKEIQITELECCKKILSNFNITFNIKDILSKSRKAELVYIRALIVVILREKEYSYSKCGAIINRDHATAIHLLKYDGPQGLESKTYTNQVKEIKSIMKQGNIEYKIAYHLKELERLKKVIKI